MTALRHLRKTHRDFIVRRLECSHCHADTAAGDLICDACADNQADEAAEEAREERGEGLEPDRQIALARVYLDLVRYGRQKDAIDRLERVLDDVAPDWRRLA